MKVDTTPDPSIVARVLDEMDDGGVGFVWLSVSSWLVGACLDILIDHPSTQAIYPATQGDHPLTQRDRPFTQRDCPFTQ